MESGVRRVLDIPELFLPGGTLAGIYGDFRLGQDVAAQSSVRSGAARSLPGLRAALGRRRPHHPARRAARCLAGPSRGHDLSGFSTFSAAFSHGKRAVAGHVSEIFPFRKTCATERGICSGGSASAARTFPRACFPGASSSAWPWPGPYCSARRCLLADEPTASLDRSNAQLVTDELVDLARSEGCTLLVVTHEQVAPRQNGQALPSGTGASALWSGRRSEIEMSRCSRRSLISASRGSGLLPEGRPHCPRFGRAE